MQPPAPSVCFTVGPGLPWSQGQDGPGPVHQAVLLLSRRLMSACEHTHPFASLTIGPATGRVNAASLSASAFQLQDLVPHSQGGSRPMQLFSLARMGPSFGSSDDSEGSDGDDDSSSSSGDGLHMSSDEDLHRLKCGICKQQLLPSRGKSGRRHMVPRIKICDACHNGYHASCCRRKQRGTQMKDGLSGPAWYCCDACQAQHVRLLLQCEKGDMPLPVRLQPPSAAAQQPSSSTAWDRSHMLSGARGSQADSDLPVVLYEGDATWQLAQGSARLGSTQWNAVADAVSVMSHEYGPFVIRQMEGSDYVAVLRRGGLPVTAATLDCFGAKGCAVDLLCTQPDARLQGHARGLVSTLEHFLASILPSDGGGQLMAVVAEPGSASGKTAQAVWQRHLGFSKLTNRQVQQLQSDVPMLAAHGDGVAVFVKKILEASKVASHTPVVKLSRTTKPSTQKQVAAHSSAQAASASAQPVEQTPQQSAARRERQPRRSYWRLRLWGWALRKVARVSTFGLLG